jgi:hypothetical protein
LLRLYNIYSSIIVKTCALVVWQNSFLKKCTTQNHLEEDDHAKLFMSDETLPNFKKGKITQPEGEGKDQQERTKGRPRESTQKHKPTTWGPS